MRGDDVVRFASDPAFAIDAEGRIVLWNDRAIERLGYAAEEALGRPCCSILRAALPGGEPLCEPDCCARESFVCHQPFSAEQAYVRHRDGDRMLTSIASLALPARVQAEEGLLAVIFLRPAAEARETTGPDRLRIYTLGCFSLTYGRLGVETERWARKQALRLLKILTHERGRPVHADSLAEILWPGAPEERGRDRLRVTVCFLRKALRQARIEPPVVETVGASYRLRPDRVWVDAEVFEGRIRSARRLEAAGRSEEALRQYQEAAFLYRGDYLPDEPYADWCAEERGRLRELFLDMTARWSRLLMAQQQYAEAADACRKALVLEPCRESLHRILMQSLWRQGRQDEALAAYHHCRSVLERELQVEPIPETRRLYERIRRSAPSSSAASRL